MKIILNQDVLNFIKIFEKTTKAQVKDCILNDQITVIINQGNLRKALADKGKHIKYLTQKLNKNIRVIEFNKNPKIFAKNLIYPNKAEIELDEKNNKIIIKTPDLKTKGKIFGRERSKLNEINNFLQHYFKLKAEIQ